VPLSLSGVMSANDELNLETKDFDFVILGTGLTECLVSAYVFLLVCPSPPLPPPFWLLFVPCQLTSSCFICRALARIGKHVLHLDENLYYGGTTASLQLDSLNDVLSAACTLGVPSLFPFLVPASLKCNSNRVSDPILPFVPVVTSVSVQPLLQRIPPHLLRLSGKTPRVSNKKAIRVLRRWQMWCCQHVERAQWTLFATASPPDVVRSIWSPS